MRGTTVTPRVRGVSLDQTPQVPSRGQREEGEGERRGRDWETERMEPPSGHPDVSGSDASVCPFAMIQAALASAPDLFNESAGPGAMLRQKPARKTFQKTDLMECAVPEGISLKSEQLQDGLRPSMNEEDEDDELEMGVQLSARAAPRGSMSLMCPVSGMLTSGTDGAIIAPPPLHSQASFMAPSVGGASKVAGSRAGASSRAGSSKSGSRASKSRSRTSSKAKGPRIKRRTKRNITFSEWEADTYIPQIKHSWDIALSSASLEEIGTTMYKTFFGNIDEEAKGMFSSPVETLGAKFAQVLGTIVSSTDNPAEMHELLKSLAPMHIAKGVKVEYLPKFGEALLITLRGVIGNRFTVEMVSAWEWLWSWISQSFIMSIEEASAEATIVSQSWDMAMDNCPGSEFGEMLFDVLFEIAPNMKSLFNKPKQILSVKFMEMIATLVSFNNDPVRLAQQSIWLGLRHVRYGARKQHVQVMGQVVISTLERAVGEEWTAEMDKAWTDLWTTSCKSMLDVTSDAEQYGEVMRQMWKDTKERTTCQKFGSSLRKMLLSGTEWVQGLSKVRADAEVSREASSAGKAKKMATLSPGKKGTKDTKEKLMADDVSVGSGKKVSSNADAASQKGEEEENAVAAAERKSNDADAVGSLFWDMLTDLCTLLWEPEQMNEKLVMITKRFYELGIRQIHLETIGRAVCTSMERALEGSWKQLNKDAWTWFWGIIGDGMANTLDVFEGGDLELIREGWELAKASRPAEELGEIFFKELARIAPHVTHLFTRPKRIQALQFINVVEMLLCFNEDPNQFFADLKPLTIRHIKYGVKADYARAFGLTVLNGVTQVLGDKFDERNRKAWSRLWTRVASCVTRSLNVGSNLVIVSLVKDDIDNFEDAMDCVPRGERFETLIHIDVNGEVVSPLDWAVMGGQVGIAKWIIDDLLTIRADRNTYYYGRETMFDTHPDIVSKLCLQMPDLLDSLFDGLMWHASMVVDSKVRVNYYVQELYGEPGKNVDSWSSPLGELVQHGCPDVFNHPAVETLLDLKWKRFGFKMYLAFQVWYTAMLALFVIGFAEMSESCSATASTIRAVTGAMAVVTIAVQSVVVTRQLYHSQAIKVFWIPVPRFLANPWNASRFVSSILLIVIAFPGTCFHVPEGQHAVEEVGGQLGWHTVLTAFTAVLLWVQILQVLVLSNKVSAFIYSVGVMFADFVLNFSAIAVIIVAFGTCLNILRQPGGYNDNIGASMLNLLTVILGIGRSDAYELDSWGLFALIVCVILVAICFLNILVAQLVNSYGILASNSVGFAKMARAYLCVEMESFLWITYRQKLFDELHFENPLEFDSSDEGPTGGVQFVCPTSIRTHPKYVADRIKRFTGEASPMDPWPSMKPTEEEEVMGPPPIADEGCVD